MANPAQLADAAPAKWPMATTRLGALNLACKRPITRAMSGRRMLRACILVLAAAPAAAYALVRTGVVPVSGGFVSPPTHVTAVGGAALCALLAALLMVRVAHREHDARGGLVGVGFLAMAGLLVIHALATPGYILEVYERNATVGLAGAFAVPTGGIVFVVALLLPARVTDAAS